MFRDGMMMFPLVSLWYSVCVLRLLRVRLEANELVPNSRQRQAASRERTERTESRVRKDVQWERTSFLTGLDEGRTLFDRDLYSVDFELNLCEARC